MCPIFEIFCITFQFRYCKLGTTGKMVPGVKTKIVKPAVKREGFFTDGTQYEVGEVTAEDGNETKSGMTKQRLSRRFPASVATCSWAT